MKLFWKANFLELFLTKFDSITIPILCPKFGFVFMVWLVDLEFFENA